MIWKVIEIPQYNLTKKDMVSDLNMSHGKMSSFVSFPLLSFTLVIKLRNSDFESHWNILVYFDKRERHAVRFTYVPWKDVLFCLIFILKVHLSHKTGKFWFYRSAKYFNIFWQKNYIRFGYVLSNSVWFGLSFAVWVTF